MRSEKSGIEHKKALMKGTRDEKVAKIAEQGLEIKEDLERKGMLSQRTRTSSALYLNKMAQGMDTQTLPVSYLRCNCKSGRSGIGKVKRSKKGRFHQLGSSTFGPVHFYL